MCGIAGIYNFSNNTFDHHTLITMSQSMAHRGPDDEGFFLVQSSSYSASYSHKSTAQSAIQKHELNDLEILKPSYQLALIHRRLSIIDLSPLGHQPMSYDEGNLWIVFNGEIYNHLEIRKELESLGCVFISNCDTEVLLAAYQIWKEGMLHKLDGMWAFTLYDKKNNLLFAARDKTGVKPFYYVNKKSHFAFASEIKTLVNTPHISDRQLHKKGIWDYIVWGVIENEQTSFWEDIYELKPSYYLIKKLDDQSLSIHNYYTPTYETKNETFLASKSEDYEKNITNLLHRGVRLRLNSDVPVAVSLSGGMDSSAVCVIAQKEYKQIFDKNISVYTASFPGFIDDETAFAEQVAREGEFQWHKISPSPHITHAALEEMVYHQDLPFLSISLYAHYKLIEQVAADGIKVFLEGLGGDELFSGYPHHNVALLREQLRGLDLKGFYDFLSLQKNSNLSKTYLLKTLLKSIFIEKLGQKAESSIIKHHRELATLSQGFKNSFEHQSSYAVYDMSNLNASLKHDSYGYYLKFLLRATDRTSMAHGVECRTPFADDFNLIDYVNKIPSSYKMHGGYTKYLLRKATEGLLPESIRWRKDKKGFASPETTWILEILQDFDRYYEQDLSDYFEMDKLKNLFEDYKAHPERYYNQRIWRIINFIVWKKVFNC